MFTQRLHWKYSILWLDMWSVCLCPSPQKVPETEDQPTDSQVANPEQYIKHPLQNRWESNIPYFWQDTSLRPQFTPIAALSFAHKAVIDTLLSQKANSFGTALSQTDQLRKEYHWNSLGQRRTLSKTSFAVQWTKGIRSIIHVGLAWNVTRVALWHTPFGICCGIFLLVWLYQGENMFKMLHYTDPEGSFLLK